MAPRALLALALMACERDPTSSSTLLHPEAIAPGSGRSGRSWYDGFATFDTTAWRPRHANKRRQHAWNDPALAFVRDGLLHIRVETRRGRHHTAQLKHRDLVTRGTVTARVRCPSAGGWWAAVWLQVDNTFAEGGLEIDVWECHRRMGKRAQHAVHEYDTKGHVGFAAHRVPADPDEWHVVSVTLEPNQPVRFTLDGVETVSPYVWPSNPVPVRLLVTGHVGRWAGPPASREWPDSALIDWISYTSR